MLKIHDCCLMQYFYLKYLKELLIKHSRHIFLNTTNDIQFLTWVKVKQLLIICGLYSHYILTIFWLYFDYMLTIFGLYFPYNLFIYWFIMIISYFVLKIFKIYIDFILVDTILEIVALVVGPDLFHSTAQALHLVNWPAPFTG